MAEHIHFAESARETAQAGRTAGRYCQNGKNRPHAIVGAVSDGEHHSRALSLEDASAPDQTKDGREMMTTPENEQRLYDPYRNVGWPLLWLPADVKLNPEETDWEPIDNTQRRAAIATIAPDDGRVAA